ncbi:uncharacterized protein [Heterodontus francisci]|uniref:uncharacterized protein n=1 Tax=Heterodontus francisci TaxID=7792 RepID=UPI00355BB6EA
MASSILVNIWRLVPKVGELSHKLVKQQPDIVILAESYLTANVPDTSITAPGYSIAAEVQRGEATNPLLDNEGLPRFSDITSEHVVPGIKQVVQEFQKGLQELEKDLEASDTQVTNGIFDQVTEKVEEGNAVDATYMDFKKAFDKALMSGNQKLNGMQLRIINSALRIAKNGGVELEGETKKRFNDIQLQLANHSEKFSNNVIDSTNAYSLLLTDKADIEDLPETTRRLLASNAVADTEQRPDPENGPWKVKLDSPSFKPMMLYSTNRQLKEQLYKAFVSRARGGSYDNGALIDEIRQLRHEFARILGYKNFAEFSISKNMAGSVERVWNFINVLRNRSYPVAQWELKTLQQFAKSHCQEGELQHWDKDYWDEQQSIELFSVTEEQLRPYFPLQRVLSGLFQLSSKLFGITIIPADQKVEVWHPDVRVFNVYDEKVSVTTMETGLTDPLSPSPSARSNLLHKKPVAFLTCNQLPPVGSVPSLLSFSEIKTLFHEFGHALQHMLTTVPYGMAAGLNNIEWDAIEFPSQFMENWLYDNNTIALISGHYQTGEPLPQSTFEQLLKAHHYRGGSIMLRQVYLAALDLQLHISTDSWTSVVKKIAERFTVMKQIPEDCVLCTFLHIFSGGYAAGYYAYEWAEVLAQDAFGAFEEVGLQNQSEVSKTGRRFRDTVLSLGGGTHPKEVFRMFRGRDPQLDFLLKAYRI